jgi:hypothetical protein
MKSTLLRPDLQASLLAPLDTKSPFSLGSPEKKRRSPSKIELAIARRAMDLWQCYHAAGPDEIVPHLLRDLGDGALSDDAVNKISKAASDWVEREFTWHPDGADLIVWIADTKRGGRE